MRELGDDTQTDTQTQPFIVKDLNASGRSGLGICDTDLNIYIPPASTESVT
eukprot:UN17007